MNKYLFTIATLALGFSLNAQVCLIPASASPFAVGTYPYSVTSADFNADGKVDLATANNAGNVSVLLGNGTGSFAAAVTFSAGTGPYSLTSADFNGDGKVDLATANYNGANVSVLLGNGTGSFAAAVNFAAGTKPASVISADFNADGKADLAVANYQTTNVSVLLGNGIGSFAAAVTFSVGTYPISVTSADFNADGKADLAVANYNSNNVSVLIGNGAGSFAVAVNFAVGSAPNSLTSADFNGDGKADLATANANSNDASVLLGTGTGSFGAAVNFSVGTTARSVTSFDYNADGKTDLAVSNQTSDDVSILLGNGTGNFAAAVNFTVGSDPNSLTSADFNADGKADLAVANVTNNNVSVLINGPPSVTANSTATVVCAGTSITLTGGGATTYTWSGGVSNGVAFIPPTGTNTYTVTGTAIAGCSNTAVITVTVSSPIVTANSTATLVCPGSSITLTGGGATTYTWSGGVSNGVAFIPPMGSTTYTVTGTNTFGCSSTNTITVNASLPAVTANSTATLICPGASITLTGGGANTYTWSSGVSDGVAFVPATTATYTVTGTNTLGCINTKTITVTVIPTPVMTSTNSISICTGNATNILLTSNIASKYTWVANNNPNTTGESITTQTTSTINNTIINTVASIQQVVYSVTPTSTTGNCVGTAQTVTVIVYPLPIVNFSGLALAYSTGSSTVTLTGSPSGGTFSGFGIAGNSFNPSVAGVGAHTITYTYTDGNGCVNSATHTTTITAVPVTPEICMVTVDSLSLYNIINWEKSLYTGVDSFFVYRYNVGSSSYLKIGAVSSNSYSAFTDTARSIGGPNGGHPQYSSWQYKLRILDDFGMLSALSPYHLTCFLQDQQNGNFNWNAYAIENGQTNPVTGYSFSRDDNNTGSFNVLVNTSGTSTTDPNYFTYQNIANWRVDGLGFNCTPTQKPSNNAGIQAVVKSKSNIRHNFIVTSINNISTPTLKVLLYPNPTSNSITVEVPELKGDLTIEIENMLGAIVYSSKGKFSKNAIDVSKLQNGVYSIRLFGTDGHYSNKIVVQR